MRLKSFTGENLSDAMQKVREALGEDAIIVATRDHPGGKIKVTAAVDNHSVAAPEAPLPGRFARVMAEELDTATTGAPPSRGPVFGAEGVKGLDEDVPEPGQDEGFFGSEQNAVLDQITEALLRHNAPSEVSDAVISAAMDLDGDMAEDLLTAALNDVFGFAPLVQEPFERPLMLVGPPGAGKTLCTSKLAARGVLGDLHPLVISADTYRAGARDQLSALTKILRIELTEADCAESLATIVREHDHADQILIDTGGLNPFERDEMAALAALVNAVDAEPVLVLPAGGDAEETAEIACTYEILGIERMIPTRLDMARRLGGILNAAQSAGLSFADASNTPQVADGLIPLNARRMARLILPGAEDDETQS